ncbi:hypothetical protein AAZX31_13G243500 [Glycine max]
MEILFSSSSLSIPRLNISFFSFCSSPWKELSKCSLLSSPKQILRTSKSKIAMRNLSSTTRVGVENDVWVPIIKWK